MPKRWWFMFWREGGAAERPSGARLKVTPEPGRSGKRRGTHPIWELRSLNGSDSYFVAEYAGRVLERMCCQPALKQSVKPAEKLS